MEYMVLDPTLDNRPMRVRLDKWLWAARFFKTPALARLAIEKQQVVYNSQQAHPGIELELGGVIKISYPARSPFVSGKTVNLKILALATRRSNLGAKGYLYELLNEDIGFEPKPLAYKKPNAGTGFLRRNKLEQHESIGNW